MDDVDRARVEANIRALHEQADFDGAATTAIKAYGPEIFGFLMAVHRDETAASDAFSSFCEGLWRSLPEFSWRSSLRTWAYAIAKNSARVVRRDAARRNRAAAPESALAEVAAVVRTQTVEFLRTEKRTRLEALRDALSEEDRALLVLRVDRGLSWNELAGVLSESDTEMSEADTLREASRLRKRFQLLKDKLRELARREGLRD